MGAMSSTAAMATTLKLGLLPQYCATTSGGQAAAGMKLTMGDPPRGTLSNTADQLR